MPADPSLPPSYMSEYEVIIRKKVYESGILTPGEWVYLVGVFGAAREFDELQTRDELERFRESRKED